MRLKYAIAAFAALMLFLITSCDKKENPVVESETVLNESSDSRRALLIDYTGHKCGICPSAGREAIEISEDFPGQVFSLAVHPNTNLNVPNSIENNILGKFLTDWRTEEGNQHGEHYGPFALPTGTVSGTVHQSSYTYGSGSWRALCEELNAQQRKVSIDIQLSYDTTVRMINIESKIDFNTSLEGDYNYVLAIVEDNIIDWQKNGATGFPSDDNYPGGDIENYVHRHVLRAQINGTRGEALIEGGFDFTSFAHAHLSHESELDEEFNEEEISIYAYIYNITTLEIEDVVVAHIIE